MDTWSSLLNGNTPILFILALLFVAISGIKLTTFMRVGLIYALSFLMLLFDVVSTSVTIAGSGIVLFLILEIFNSDEKLVTLFSVKYKIIDFLYRLIFEYQYTLFIISVLLLFLRDKTVLSPLVFVASGAIIVCVLLLLLAKATFSSKTVTEIVQSLESKVKIIDRYDDEQIFRKYEILVFMEDRSFFSRKELQHLPTTSQIYRGLKKLVTLNHLRHPIKGVRKIFERGYGTIEMQLIRTIGLSIGSYQCKIRRKIFEILYANMVFNSYQKRYEKVGGSWKNARPWILHNYINSVSLRYGEKYFYHNDDETTIEQLYNKPIEKISDEQFFVWCLGLRYFENGVGEIAVDMHWETMCKFQLNRKLVLEAIATIKNK